MIDEVTRVLESKANWDKLEREAQLTTDDARWKALRGAGGLVNQAFYEWERAREDLRSKLHDLTGVNAIVLKELI